MHYGAEQSTTSGLSPVQSGTVFTAPQYQITSDARRQPTKSVQLGPIVTDVVHQPANAQSRTDVRPKGKARDKMDGFKRQMGQRVPFTTWHWRQQQRKIHLNSLANMESYVTQDVRKHRDKVKKFEKFFFNPGVKEKMAAFEQQQIDRDNKAMLRRLFLVSVTETEISAANNPKARLGNLKRRHERLRAMQAAQKMKIGHINRENKLLHSRIVNVRSSFDHKKMKADFKRHIKMRNAMRKVDDPEPKKKPKRRRRRRRKRRTNASFGSPDDRLRGSGMNISQSLPSLHEAANRHRQALEEEYRRKNEPIQPEKTSLVSIGGRRALVKSWRDEKAFHFELIDPDTGAAREFEMTDLEVYQLAESRFPRMHDMHNEAKLKHLTKHLPELLGGV